MTTQQAKDLTQVAQGFIQAFNSGDWTRFKATLAANVNYEETGTQRRLQDADAYVQLCQGWKQAFIVDPKICTTKRPGFGRMMA